MDDGTDVDQQQRRRILLQPARISATAWQVVFAGLANLLFAVLFERVSGVQWTARGIGAMLYLVVCGSWIGYTAYIWLLQHVPTSKVATYAYVNPVVAVLIGALLYGEKFGRLDIAAVIVVMLGVAVVKLFSGPAESISVAPA